MTKLQRGAWPAIGCLLALLLGSVPARSQTSFAEFSGFYTVVDNNTKAESLMRLEFIPGEVDGFMVATVFRNDGTYRVFAGPIFTQGGIPTSVAYLSAAKAPYQLLKRPRLGLMNPESVDQKDQCQIVLRPSNPDTLGYTCSAHGRISSGSLTRLRR
jgi:hypothetical protein